MRCENCPSPECAVVGPEVLRSGRPFLVVVGQNPGATEARQGRPFVGPSGQLLRPVLSVWPGGVKLVNAVRCATPTPAAAHRQACSSCLALDVADADAVLVLGAFAREAVKPVSLQVKVEFAPHPALVLRGGMRFAAWRQAVRVALTALGAPPPAPRIIRQAGTHVVAVDVEYKGDTPHAGGEIVAVAGEGFERTFARPEADALRDLLSRAELVVFHHAVHDLIALRQWGIYPNNPQCTMTAAGLIHPGQARDLPTLSAIFADTALESVPVTAWKAGKTSDAEVARICLSHARATRTLWAVFESAARASDLYWNTYRPLLPILVDMATIPVDTQALESVISDYERRRTQLEDELTEFATINWYSPEQVANYFQGLGIKLPTTTTGRPSTDERWMKEVDHPAATLVLRLRHLRKILSTYLYAFKRYGELRTVYDPVGTMTGRMASRDINAQNLPEDVRVLLKPPDGYLWAKADYEQHEVRVAAYLSQDADMLSATASEDLHAEMGKLILGREPREGQERRLVKALTFASLYLGRPETIAEHALALGVRLPMEEAERLFVAFWERFKGYRRWVEWVSKEIRQHGVVLSAFGRPLRYPRNPSLRQIRQAVNALVQGTASDLTCKALLRIVKAGFKPLVIVHDELGVAVRDEEEAQALVDLMLEPGWPLAVSVKVRPRWGATGEGDSEILPDPLSPPSWPKS